MFSHNVDDEMAPDDRHDEHGARGDNEHQRSLELPRMVMTQSCYRHILAELTKRPPEAGGILLGPEDDDDIITHFLLDEYAHTTPTSFTLAAAWLNENLKQYRHCRMNGKGLIHSHPPGCSRPSYGDLAYVRKLLANDRNQKAPAVFLPIVCDGRMYPYVITRREEGVSVAHLLLV